jgi:hypothetical protein
VSLLRRKNEDQAHSCRAAFYYLLVYEVEKGVKYVDRKTEGYEPNHQSRHTNSVVHKTHLGVEDILVERNMIRIIK